MAGDDQVREALDDLAGSLELGSDRDLAPAVLDRIRAGEVRRPHHPERNPKVVWALAACAALVGLSFVSPVRDAAATALELVGIDLETAEVGTSPPQPQPPGDDELGRPVPVPEATVARLGAADEAFLLDAGDHSVATLVWRKRAGVPVSSASGASMLLSVFHGGPPETELLRKILFEGAESHRVVVDEHPGVFVGGPQTVLFYSTDLEIKAGESRLSANSLIWQQDGATLRLEADLSEQSLLDVARSVSRRDGLRVPED